VLARNGPGWSSSANRASRFEINARETNDPRRRHIRGMTLMNAHRNRELKGIHRRDHRRPGKTKRLRPHHRKKKIPLAEASQAHESGDEAGSYGKIVLLP